MAVDYVTNQKTIQQIINETSKSTEARNTSEMGKDEFLNLLVTQLRYQDPLNPTDDKEFLAQMAQFSALEQMQNLNSSYNSSKAFSLMGKYVTGNVTDSETDRTTEIQGAVTSVRIDHGSIYVIVNGKDIPIDNITSVSDGPNYSGSSLSSYTGLIGYKADGVIYDPETGDMIKVSGVVKSLKQGVYEDYAVLDGVTVEICEVLTSGSTVINRDEIVNKLAEAKELGTTLSMTVIDSNTGKKVPISAKIKDYHSSADGKITVDLDECNVPVESIFSIAKAGSSAEGQ